MRRAEFSRKIRAAAISRANGKCERCEAALKPGEAEVDHILPCALGGKPELVNAQVLCSACHKDKTASDVRSIRKADRQRDKSTGAIRPKRQIKSRGFEASEKPQKINKRALPELPRRSMYGEQR